MMDKLEVVFLYVALCAILLGMAYLFAEAFTTETEALGNAIVLVLQ